MKRFILLILLLLDSSSLAACDETPKTISKGRIRLTILTGMSIGLSVGYKTRNNPKWARPFITVTFNCEYTKYDPKTGITVDHKKNTLKSEIYSTRDQHIRALTYCGSAGTLLSCIGMTLYNRKKQKRHVNSGTINAPSRTTTGVNPVQSTIVDGTAGY